MKTHSGNTRPILRRLQFIMEELARMPRTAGELAKQLEVSTKSVYRDLEFFEADPRC